MSKSIDEGLSFDDVLLVPQYSEILPSQTDLRAKVTAKIDLNIPILSSLPIPTPTTP